MRRVTIKDVAREAGVSISTVSNAINNVDVLHPDTKAHILEVAKRINYVPNFNGKMLKAKKSNAIGFITNSVSGPYYSVLIDVMARKCEEYGYDLNIYITKDVTAIRTHIMGDKVDGAIVYEDIEVTELDIEKLANSHAKIVFLDRDYSTDRIASVTFDSFKGGYDATRYLLNLGMRKIAYMGSVDTIYDSRERLRGYEAALEEAGITVNEDYILHGYFSEEGGFNATKMLISKYAGQMPDAIFAGNDLSAIGCMKALVSEGYNVPDDISVIGFDDIEVAEYFQPSLTTVRNPIAKQAVHAIETLINLIDEKEKGSSIKLEGELVIRNSCKYRLT